MSLSHLARYAFSLSPQAAAGKAVEYAARVIRFRLQGLLWRNRETYAPTVDQPLPPASLLGPIDGDMLSINAEALKELGDSVLAHRFDLLGSGPVTVVAKSRLETLSPGNRRRGAAIGKLIDPAYRPIDWQLDFKSGYRWRADRLSGSLAYGHEPGVDVKVPWELARCQHLSWLACRNLVEPSDRWVGEFRNQVLDFAAANPPGYGVNWMCTMDVAIRAANLLLAHDLLATEFDAPFKSEFHALVMAHGRHIFANLEWHETHRGNHYLANLVGLLFVAAYVPPSAESAAWMKFAGPEFIAEVGRQFGNDGANFEASTGYHRLSAELAVYGTALLLGQDRDGTFPAGYFERLQRMAEFSLHGTKPNGRVVQIGDNDSGRLFKLAPSPDLDHRAVVGAINGLFGRADLADFAGPARALEGQIISRLAGGKTLPAAAGRPPALDRFSGPTDAEPARLSITGDIRIVPPDASVLQGLTAFSYPDFGLYGWRSPRFFLSVRCGPIGQNGNGGHAHNDQLAVELNIDGEDWIADPGTGVYTAAPLTRDAYRSADAHFVPRGNEGKEGEPASLKLGLFRLEDRARAQCLAFSKDRFEGRHWGYGRPLHRRVEIGEGHIRITDGFADEAGTASTPVVFSDAAALRRHLGLVLAFSPGYGIFEN